MTKSLNDELPEGKIWEADLCVDEHGCRSISRYGQSPMS